MDDANATVSVAERSQYSAIYDLLESARQWLIGRGTTRQWPTSIPPDLLRERIERGEVYVALSGGIRVGTFTLLWDDAGTWGAQPPDAGYLHSLAVGRMLAGQGWGVYERAVQ